LNDLSSLESESSTCKAPQDLISIPAEFLERLLRQAVAGRRSLVAALKAQEELIDQLKDELLKQ
jgi:hypothetical protein